MHYTRTDALTLIAAARHEFTTLIAALPPAARVAQGSLKDWSPKDEMAHLAYWIEVFVAQIQARRAGQPLMDTRDYLRRNDIAWAARKDQSWAEVEASLESALAALEGEIRAFSDDELVDAQRFTIEPDTKTPRPLLRNLIYEMIEHPLVHMVGIYRKIGDEVRLRAMLTRIETPLKARGFSRFAASARRKIKGYAG
jgi:hypothetical protein